MDDNRAGFRELEHTADWALEVWAPDLGLLFAQAAQGMYWLMETHLTDGPRLERTLVLEGVDAESLLVTFLGELLYIGESEQIGFDQFNLSLTETRLTAHLRGASVADIKKEIKAVTYHNLEVRRAEQGYSVVIVFDV